MAKKKPARKTTRKSRKSSALTDEDLDKVSGGLRAPSSLKIKTTSTSPVVSPSLVMMEKADTEENQG